MSPYGRFAHYFIIRNRIFRWVSYLKNMFPWYLLLLYSPAGSRSVSSLMHINARVSVFKTLLTILKVIIQPASSILVGTPRPSITPSSCFFHDNSDPHLHHSNGELEHTDMETFRLELRMWHVHCILKPSPMNTAATQTRLKFATCSPIDIILAKPPSQF